MDKIDNRRQNSNPNMWDFLDNFNTVEDFARWIFCERKRFSVKHIASLMNKGESWFYKRLERKETGQEFTATEIGRLTLVTQYRWFINFLLRGTPFCVIRKKSKEQIINKLIGIYNDDSTIFIL